MIRGVSRRIKSVYFGVESWGDRVSPVRFAVGEMLPDPWLYSYPFNKRPMVECFVRVIIATDYLCERHGKFRRWIIGLGPKEGGVMRKEDTFYESAFHKFMRQRASGEDEVRMSYHDPLSLWRSLPEWGHEKHNLRRLLNDKINERDGRQGTRHALDRVRRVPRCGEAVPAPVDVEERHGVVSPHHITRPDG